MELKCREHFNAGPKIFIDASIVGFKGRISFEWYNPQKPTKGSMRVYALADGQTGYIWLTNSHTTAAQLIASAVPRFPLHAGLCFTCRRKWSKLHQAVAIICIRIEFVRPPMLAEELRSHSILLTGTVMTNSKAHAIQQLKNKMKKR
ncbi:hypothetical protein HPB48_015653 [Haemaphysalis longicornis]|uniref:PiggyBac transposable element-derived protein domain-containing protein n=1 Tax=Haemaphysalis longicornis TaxID=44386 RepID=A0A9J6GI46_HAELO|nr:hypothetical protein HPB48_015653 [Haemaphysalis longicornis]